MVVITLQGNFVSGIAFPMYVLRDMWFIAQ